MRPDIRSHFLPRHDSIVDTANPDAKLRAEKIHVEHAGRAKNAVIIVDLRVQFHPCFDSERAIEADVGLGPGIVAAVEAEGRAEEGGHYLQERGEVGIIAEDTTEFVEGSAIDFIFCDRPVMNGFDQCAGAGFRARDNSERGPALSRGQVGPEFIEQKLRSKAVA